MKDKEYIIKLSEDELIRFYANKIIEDALEDCSEFHYDMNVKKYADNGFVEQHKNQIIERINKDDRVTEVYFDQDYSTINMCFGIDYCPYYYEDYDLNPDMEREYLRTFIYKELKGVEPYIDVTTTRSMIRHFMDSYIEHSIDLCDDDKDAIYYSIKKHICNIGFNEKYIDKYEVYVNKENINELMMGLKKEIDKLYFEELPFIREISISEVDRLLDKYNNKEKFTSQELGKFIAKENEIYLGIDNTTGDMFMEDFDDLKKCIDYINERDKNDFEEEFEEEP